MKVNQIILFLLFLTIVSCEGSYYKEIMEPVIKKKLADPNPLPIFYGEEEPPIPTHEEIVNDIRGIDRNKNGIRDDLDIWINRTGENFNEVMALRQKAKSLQNVLNTALDGKGKEAEKAMNTKSQALSCMELVFYSNKEDEKLNRIRAKLLTVNYFPKVKTTISYEFYRDRIMLIGGGIHYRNEDIYKNCNFKVENLKELTLGYFKAHGLNVEDIKWEE